MYTFVTVSKLVTKCRYCRGTFARGGRGRPALYCGRSCRQRAFERRKALQVARSPLRALERDLLEFELRRRIVTVLELLGYVEGPARVTAVRLRLLPKPSAPAEGAPPTTPPTAP